MYRRERVYFQVYEYVGCVDRLHDIYLLSRESFFSSLTGDTVSESDYTHVENVWQRFFIRTLGEYSDLYLKIAVLLLADIFENFRDQVPRAVLKLHSRSCVLLYFVEFYMGRHAEAYVCKFQTPHRY